MGDLTSSRSNHPRVDALFRLADDIEKRVAAATARVEKLTQAILAKAFRGELVPTDAELARREGRAYEPAGVLLQRIRAERQAKDAASRGRKSRGGAGRPSVRRAAGSGDPRRALITRLVRDRNARR